MTRLGIAVLVSAIALTTHPASAQGGAPVAAPAGTDSIVDARVAKIASELRCPVCQGESVQDSPSELSGQMRALIRQQVTDGRTDDEVRAYFVSKYGEFILLTPQPHGFNLVAYALPAVALLAGALVIMRGVRKWTAAPASSAPSESAGD